MFIDTMLASLSDQQS